MYSALGFDFIGEVKRSFLKDSDKNFIQLNSNIEPML